MKAIFKTNPREVLYKDKPELGKKTSEKLTRNQSGGYTTQTRIQTFEKGTERYSNRRLTNRPK